MTEGRVQPWRILIAEASKEHRSFLSNLLSREGYQILEAEDNWAVLRLMAEGLADVVLLDLSMSCRRGLALLREVRRVIRAVPLIALGPEDVAAAVEAIKQGAEDYLARPVTAEKLLRAVQNALREVQSPKGGPSGREQEARQPQAQRMEALGRLTNAVAHNLGNQLTVMMMASAVLGQAGAGGSLRAELLELRRAASRAAALVRGLSASVREQESAWTVVDLNALVMDVTTLLRPLIREDVELSVTLEPSPGNVYADPGQVEQAVVNLVLHARDAMPRGGALSIETAHVDLDETAVRKHRDLRAGPHVRLAVRDSGEGLEVETQADPVEPFAALQRQGRGPEPGLAAVGRIVQRHGGAFEVVHASGQGTTCIIYLPRLEEELAPTDRGTDAVEAGGAGGWETILLVEDHGHVRTLVRDVLRGRGYQVLEAEDGVEAMKVGEGHQGPIHLLMTDVVMPRMSGTELARRLGSLRPNLKVIYMSGYSGTELESHGFGEPLVPALQKPFTKETLLSMVRRVLDTNAG